MVNGFDALESTNISEERVRGRCRELVDLLGERNVTIALSESFTAGLATYLMIDEPNAAQVVLGSAVVYHSAEKRRVLGVTAGPVVTARCAIEMSAGVLQLFGADSSIAWTGVAGPDTQEGQPVGTVFVSTRLASHARLQSYRYDGTPNEIRLQAIVAGVDSLIEMVEHVSTVPISRSRRGFVNARRAT